VARVGVIVHVASASQGIFVFVCFKCGPGSHNILKIKNISLNSTFRVHDIN